MGRPEVEPEGFEPQLLAYFTANEVTKYGPIIIQALEARKSTPDSLRLFAKTEEEYTCLTYVFTIYRHTVANNISFSSMEGFHIWSTPGPQVEIDNVPRTYPNTKIIPFEERKALLGFFRENTRDLPDVTTAWFKMPQPFEEFADMNEEERQAALIEVAQRISEGGSAFPDSPFEFKNMKPEVADDIRNTRRFMLDYEKHSPWEAIQFGNQRMREAADRFEGTDLEVVNHWIYNFRASVLGQLIQQGGLINLPEGNRLRSHLLLSLGADLMRQDITFGVTTDRTTQISQCFGLSGMDILQRRVLEKYIQPDEVIYSSGRPIPRYSVPEDSEIALMQKRILARVQEVL